MERNLVFISGGVRSGKSSFAEKFAERLHGDLHYIATARVTDDDMARRIQRHQEQRERGHRTWTTWECSVDLHKIAPNFQASHIVLLDCLTILLANELFRHELTDGQVCATYEKEVIRLLVQTIEDISCRVKSFVVVSNEVLYEGVHHNAGVEMYQRAIGHFHQELVNRVTCAIHVESGIPIIMKGERYFEETLLS